VLQRLASLESTITQLNQEVTQLNQEVTQLNQEVEDSHYILPPRHLVPVKQSSILLLESDGTPSGVGFFVSPNTVITANHNLKTYPSSASSVNVKLFTSTGRLVSGNLSVKVRHADLDLAVLIFAGTHHSHLTIINDASTIGEKRLAVTSFALAMTSELADIHFDGDGFAVLSAQMYRISKSHIVYSSNLFSGDSGGAVVFSKDGEVVALHLETVNQANEELSHGSYSLEDVADSVNSIVRGFSQGFLGLRLDSPVVRALIFN
jgi:Trypsin-like peptidase domain